MTRFLKYTNKNKNFFDKPINLTYKITLLKKFIITKGILMFYKKSLFLFFIFIATIFYNTYSMKNETKTTQNIIQNAVYFKIHTNETCYAGYFYDLRDQYHWACLGDNQNPSQICWNISQIRNLYSNRCEICISDYCFENLDCNKTLGKPLHIINAVIITYHDKLWQRVGFEDITATNLFKDDGLTNIISENLIQHINSRLDPNAKPESCHAEIIWENKQRIVRFCSAIPDQCILSMPYDGPALFTQKEYAYFSNFLDLEEFRNPAKEIEPWDAILHTCLVQ